MLVHNRTGFVVFAALMALVLIGAGCGGAEKPKASGETRNVPGDASSGDDAAAADDVRSVSVGSAPIGSVSTDDGAITNWAMYRSESLGISIPYPEGWLAVGADSGGGVEFFEESPIENSESSSRVYLATSNRPAVAELDYPNRLSMTEESHSGVSTIKLTFLVDADSPTEVTAAYIWERGGITYRLVGTEGDAVLLYMVDHLEVSP